MLKIFFACLISALMLLTSCTKNNTPGNANEAMITGTVIVSGAFVSNVHPTSGTVKVIQDAAGKKHLVFENFKTDNGPDLRVWLSPSIAASPYQELGLLKAVTGNFSYELNDGINYTVNNRVLIWCKDFSVLFGNAGLQ